MPLVVNYGTWNERVTATRGWQRQKTHAPTRKAFKASAVLHLLNLVNTRQIDEPQPG